jgi:hypothetical protein
MAIPTASCRAGSKEAVLHKRVICLIEGGMRTLEV